MGLDGTICGAHRIIKKFFTSVLSGSNYKTRFYYLEQFFY